MIWASAVPIHWAGPSSDGYGYSAVLRLPGWTQPLAGEAEYTNSLWIQTLYRIPHGAYWLALAAAGCGLREYLVGRERRLRGLRWHGEILYPPA